MKSKNTVLVEADEEAQQRAVLSMQYCRWQR